MRLSNLDIEQEYLNIISLKKIPINYSRDSIHYFLTAVTTCPSILVILSNICLNAG